MGSDQWPWSSDACGEEPSGAFTYLCRRLEDGSCEILLPALPEVTVRAPSVEVFVAWCAAVAGAMTGAVVDVKLAPEWERTIAGEHDGA